MSTTTNPYLQLRPEVREFPAVTFPAPQMRTLSNGLPVEVIDHGDIDMFTLAVVTPGGTCEAAPGVAPLASQLLREGCRDLDGTAIADMLEYNGARLLSAAEAHCTMVRIYGLGRTAPALTHLLARMMYTPTLPADSFEVKREQLAQKVELGLKRVESRAAHAMMQLMAGNDHPMARELTPEMARAITRDDVVQWWEQIASGPVPGTTLVLAGRVTPELWKALDDSFGKLPVVPASLMPDPLPFIPAPGALHKIEMPQSTQSAVRIAFPAPLRDHPDYIGLRQLTMLLGGYFGSRLMTNIREDKGLTYGIHSYLAGYRSGSYIGIDCSTDPANVDMLIDETLAEVRRLATDDYPAAELFRVRQHMMTTLVTALDSAFEMADYRLTCLMSGIPDGYFDAQVRQTLALDGKRLRELAGKYLLHSAPTIVVAGR